MGGDVADRSILLESMKLPQNARITDAEIARRICVITPFWRFSLATQKDCFPQGDEMHPLIAAAGRASTEIFDSFHIW
jgi:hypothetical protein